MTKYVVTDLGPIDRRPPGTDVTGVYRAAVLARLIDDGYVEEVKVKTAKRKSSKVKASEVSDGD